MPIEIRIIETPDGEVLIVDGHETITKEVIKNKDIVDWLEDLGYIHFNIEE